jgi:hypothetical protein
LLSQNLTLKLLERTGRNLETNMQSYTTFDNDGNYLLTKHILAGTAADTKGTFT